MRLCIALAGINISAEVNFDTTVKYCEEYLSDETVQKISEWLSQYTEAQLTEMVFNSTHVSLCVAIAWALLVAVFYFTVSRFILSRKLNLE